MHSGKHWENSDWKSDAVQMLYTHSCRRPDAHGSAFRSHTVPRAVRSARRAHGSQKHAGKLHTIHVFSAQLHLQARLHESTDKNVPFGFLSLSFSTKTRPKAPSGCMIIKVLKYNAPLSYATLHLTSSEVPRVRRVSDASFGSLLLN